MGSQPHIPSYQVGGSLFSGASSYVERPCDRRLYQALSQGELCYVLNSRQMGKSSLLIHARDRLAHQGYRCATLDLTQLGTEQVTPAQWYRGAVTELNRTLSLLPLLELSRWWKANADLSLTQRLNLFIRDILLANTSENIIIFIDETDCILGLPFPVDDFFALIRYCYNQRSSEPAYRRLNFALAGVLSPADFIRDRQRTPFNVGTSVVLGGISLAAAEPLIQGLSNGLEQQQVLAQQQIDPEQISSTARQLLGQILYWTGGQPFLSQKLCSLTVNRLKTEGNSSLSQLHHGASAWIDQLVQEQILHNWESQDEPEHLRSIRDRLLGKRTLTPRLLSLYRQLLQDQPLACDDSLEQQELFLSGLVQRAGDQLRIKNPIYRQVFDLVWVDRQLNMLRPYAETFQAWVQSEQQDPSRLLRGNALKEAIAWSQGKSLSDADYRYLSKSQDYDRQLAQQSLEAERTQAVEARLAEQQKRLQQEAQALTVQRRLLAGLSGAFVIALALGATAFAQSRQAQREALSARRSELEALVASSRGALGAEQQLEALVAAIKAKRRASELDEIDASLSQAVEQVLGKAVYNAVEQNQLPGIDGAILSLAYSPTGDRLATAGVGKAIRLWASDGRLINTLEGHESTIRSVRYSPDGEQIASTGDDKTIRLWSAEGEPIATLVGHEAGVWKVLYGPDGQLFSSSSDGTIRRWSQAGELLQTIDRPGSGLTAMVLHPDGKRIAASSTQGQVLIWELETGRLLKEIPVADAPLWSLVGDKKGQFLLTGGSSLRRLDWEGSLEPEPLGQHDADINSISLSQDETMIATGSADQTVKLWTAATGKLQRTLGGHQTALWSVAFRPGGKTLASASAGGRVRIWQQGDGLFESIQAHQAASWSVDVVGAVETSRETAAQISAEATPQTAAQTVIATAGADRLLQLWNLDGRLLQSLPHDSPVWRVRSSTPHQRLVTGTEDGKVWLWDTTGKLLKQLKGTGGNAFLSLDFSPAGAARSLIAGAGADTNILLWTLDGERFGELEGHDNTIWDMAFGPQGKTLLTGSSEPIAKLWSIDGELLQELNHEAAIFSVAMDPQGELLATGGGDSNIKLWSPAGELQTVLEGHSAGIWGLAFTPDGERLLSSSVDTTVKVWNREGKLLQTLYGHGAPVRDLKIGPQGKLVSTMGQNGRLLLWDLDAVQNLDLIDYACNWAQDYLQHQAELSDEERSLCHSDAVVSVSAAEQSASMPPIHKASRQ